MKKVASKYFTKEDGKKLEVRLIKLDSKLDEKINEIRDDMKQWHSDLMDIVDGLASEVKDNREFRDITTNQIVETNGKVGKLEKKVFGVASS